MVLIFSSLLITFSLSTFIMALSWRPTTVQFKKDCRDYEWKEGEIAFLKDHTEFSFSDSDNLIKPGQLQRGATKHPVIILKRHSTNSTYVLVTPVSAYGSGPDNKFLPPWKQRRHQFRATDDFRAFSGSERPTNQRPDLFLEAGSMPKPRVSWVNVQNVYLVPIRTLKFFDKTEKVLCVNKASLADLRQHALENNTTARRLLDDPRLRLKTSTPNDTDLPSLRRKPRSFLSHNKNIRLAPPMASYNKRSGSSTSPKPSTSTTFSSATSLKSTPTTTLPCSTSRTPASNIPAPNIPASKTSAVVPGKPVSWAAACA